MTRTSSFHTNFTSECLILEFCQANFVAEQIKCISYFQFATCCKFTCVLHQKIVHWKKNCIVTYQIKSFLEHIFEKMCPIDLVLSSVCPSVRPSVRLFFFISAPRGLKFWIWAKDYVFHRITTGILDPWPRSPGIWPWLEPLTRKIHLCKYNLGYFASN
jgi:hypothetical protein